MYIYTRLLALVSYACCVSPFWPRRCSFVMRALGFFFFAHTLSAASTVTGERVIMKFSENRLHLNSILISTMKMCKALFVASFRIRVSRVLIYTDQ